MNPVMAVLGVLGLSTLFRKRPVPQSVGRTRATLAPPLLLLVGLAGIAVAKSRAGTLRRP